MTQAIPRGAELARRQPSAAVPVEAAVSDASSRRPRHAADDGLSVLGPWKIGGLAAEGALARVYRAWPHARGETPAANQSSGHPAGSPIKPDETLKSDVGVGTQSVPYAIKILRPEWRDHPEAVRVFAREALVGRQVAHRNLVPVLASNVGRPPRYLVMPWLDGRTLGALLRDTASSETASSETVARSDLPSVLWYARQVATALDALHRSGWTHGDVKPSNVMISAGGHVTLLDAGFAQREGESIAAVDRCVMGTCAYMAPELLASRLRADIRADLYSVGVILYQALCGRLPYQGSSAAELATRHRTAAAPPPRRLAPHLPREVAELIVQLLAKNPLRRPQSPAELVERLVRLEIATLPLTASA